MSLADVNAAEWQKIRRVADALLDLPPDQWDLVSRTELGDNESLRQAALELARAYDDSQDLLGCKPFPKIEHPAPETVLTPGQVVGAYRIEREIGHGGMGRVYAASRADGAFEKSVAIKLVRLPGSTAMERFRAERRILASLEYENIARLYDAGTTPDGALYFIMEYVDGIHLDTWCRNLDRRATVQLFHTVVKAVAYANRGGVIHRDLKPANILVTAAGIPKLLDFGIASLNSNPGTASVTGITPAYASPEQLAGFPATERSEVYSLGLLLRDLLTNRSQLPDDLSAILQRALAEDPRMRYDNAGELADDLSRYLDGYPVRALPITFRYRTTAFIRRHRLSVFLTAALLLLCAASVGGLLWQQRHNEAQLRAADEFARNILGEETRMRGLPGVTEVRRNLVQEALNHLQEVAPEGARDPDLAADLADAYIRIGIVLGIPGAPSLGDYPAAEASIRRGRALAEDIVRRWPDSQRGHGSLASGLAYEEALLGWRGDDAACIRQGTRAQTEFHKLAAITPDLAVALDQNEGMLTRCYTKLGQMDAAVRTIRQWIAREEKSPSTADALATAYGRLARTLYEAGDVAGARAAFRQSITLDRASFRHDPNYSTRIILAQELISAASARPLPCREKEDFADIRESADLAQQAWSLDRQNATAFTLVADSQRCFAMNLDGNGNAAQARKILDRNHQFLLTGDPALPGTRSRIAENWIESSIAAQDEHDLKAANQDAQQSLDAMQKGRLQPADQLLLTECFSRLAGIAVEEGRTAEAAALARQEIQAARSYALGVPGRNTTLTLARTLQTAGKQLLPFNREESLAALREAVATFEQVPYPTASETAEAQRDLERASTSR